MQVLHVTNGTSVSLSESGLAGEVLAWVDALHEGPVPAGLGPDELRRIRGLFLDSEGPGETSAMAELERRDRALERFAQHEEVVLWFEHDLYDQLQLIQILDRLRQRAVLEPASATRLSLICIDQYLGQLTGPQLAALWPERRPVTPGELDQAAAAWQAFRSPDPMDIERLLRRDTSALPFLAAAMGRHLQQFPSVENGLGRTERQILELVRAGTRSFDGLFAADQRLEETIFMGDGFYRRYLCGLTECRHPLLRIEDGDYQLTETGDEMLEGRTDHVHRNGVNRWLGGVHLNGREVLWRWDQRARRLVAH